MKRISCARIWPNIGDLLCWAKHTLPVVQPIDAMGQEVTFSWGLRGVHGPSYFGNFHASLTPSNPGSTCLNFPVYWGVPLASLPCIWVSRKSQDFPADLGLLGICFGKWGKLGLSQLPRPQRSWGCGWVSQETPTFSHLSRCVCRDPVGMSQ